MKERGHVVSLKELIKLCLAENKWDIFILVK